jgi:Lipocalin-like domain
MKVFLALILCLLASCAGLQSPSPSSLVGEWRYADKIQGCHYVFDRNGTFSGDVTYHGKTISKFTGRWSVDGNTLHYTYASDSLDRIPPGATDRDKLLSVHSEFFIIQAADGSKRRYLRVPREKMPGPQRDADARRAGEGRAPFLLAEATRLLELSR